MRLSLIPIHFRSLSRLALLALCLPAAGVTAAAREAPVATEGRPWAAAVGDRNRDFAAAIAVDGSGRTIVAGQFQGSARLLAEEAGSQVVSAGDTDIFVLALDPEGNLLWTRSFGGPGQDEARALATDAAGHIYLTGFFTRSARFGSDPERGTLTATGSAGSSDVFVAKLDVEGELVWVRGFGGERGDVGFDLALEERGAIYVTGYFQGDADLDPGAGRHQASARGGTDAFLVKLDPAGELIWARAGGGERADEGRAVAVDGRSRPVVAGNFTGDAAFPTGGDSPPARGARDVFLWWLDSSGATRAVTAAGGPGSDSVEDLAVEASGATALTGSFSTEIVFGDEAAPRPSRGPLDAFVARWDEMGQPSWLRALGGGGADFGFGLAVDPIGGELVVAGFSQLPREVSGRSGEFRSWVEGLDASGATRWRRELTSDAAIQALGLAVAADGSPHVTGIFKGTARVELGGRFAELPPRGKFDVFVARLRP